MSASRTFYSLLIRSIAPKYGHDPDLIEALILHESSGFADAFRYEPKFYSRYLAKRPEWAAANPRRVSSSYGLMQIMYVVAAEMGFRGQPEELFLPEVNLDWGCRKIKELYDWAHARANDERTVWLSTLAAYNGGKADNEPGHQPRLRNEVYAKAVLRAAEELKRGA